MMRYKLLGKSGLRVSELCLGTMTFGEDWGWGASKEVSKTIFDTFVDQGGNFIDTACNYTNGTAEKFVGEFVASDRDGYVIATKYTLRNHAARANDLNAGGNHRKNMMQTVEGSLRRLNTEYIDMLWLHFWDFTTPVEEFLRAMDDLVRMGKVHYVGISDSPAWVAAYATAIAELRGWSRFVGFQGNYNLIERGAERDVLPMTRALDMAFLAFGLLDGGTLTGKFNQSNTEDTRVKKPDPQALAAAEAVVQIANEIDRTPSQVATKWVQQQSSNIIPIIGARREAQIHDNLNVLDFALSDEQVGRLSAISAPAVEYPATFFNRGTQELVFGKAQDLLDNHHRFGR